jgi:Cutinase
MRNRRWASRAAASVVLAVSVAAFCLCGVAVTTPPASAASCKQVLVIGVRGSAETSKNFGGFGETVVRAVNRFRATLGTKTSVETQAFDYEARSVFAAGNVLMPKLFFDSADSGISQLRDLLSSRTSACPKQKLVLIGYSQGALVINRALVELGTAVSSALGHVASVELIADPQRIGTSPYATGGANNAFNGSTVATGVYPSDQLPDAVMSRTDSYCVKNDLVCAWNPNSNLVTAVLNAAINEGLVRVHGSYKTNGDAAEAGEHAARRVRGFKLSGVGNPPATARPPQPATTSAPVANFATFSASNSVGDSVEGRITIGDATPLNTQVSRALGSCSDVGGVGDRNLYIPFHVEMHVTSSLPVLFNVSIQVDPADLLGAGTTWIATTAGSQYECPRSSGKQSGLYWRAAQPGHTNVGDGYVVIQDALSPQYPTGNPAAIQLLYAGVTWLLGTEHPGVTLAGPKAVECRFRRDGIVDGQYLHFGSGSTFTIQRFAQDTPIDCLPIE